MSYRPAPKKKLKASPAELKHRAAIKEKLSSMQLEAKNTAMGKSTDARKRRKQKNPSRMGPSSGKFKADGKFKGSFLGKLDK